MVTLGELQQWEELTESVTQSDSGEAQGRRWQESARPRALHAQAQRSIPSPPREVSLSLSFIFIISFLYILPILFNYADLYISTFTETHNIVFFKEKQYHAVHIILQVLHLPFVHSTLSI